MLGTKRRNVSFSSNSDDNNKPFQSKRVAAESPFGGQAVASAEVEAGPAPSLDRRKAARQRVRALNTEFASWVQSQVRDHPDELWEDGVRDYLAHASDILEKFTDVVNWLNSNGGSGGSSVSILGSYSGEKKNGLETVSKDQAVSGNVTLSTPSTNGLTTSSSSPISASSTPPWSFGLSACTKGVSQSSSPTLTTSWNPGVFSNSESASADKMVSSSSSPGFGVSFNSQTTSSVAATSFKSSTSSGLFSTSTTPSFSTSPTFTTPLSAGAFSNSQLKFTFGGNQSSASLNDKPKEDADEDEPEQPSSPSVKRSEEKGVVVVHETKCKLYIKPTNPADKEPWKDKGTGQLFIKCQEGASKGTKESKPIILVRNDVGRIMLNASLYPGIKTTLQKNAIVAIFHILDDSAGDSSNAKAIARTFLIRVKNEEERNKLADSIREHAPAA